MASSHRICSATVDGGREITTSVLTQADWVDIAIPLATDHDRFAPAMAHPAALTGALTDDMASRAAQRLAEIRLLGIRLVDMPLYRLLSVDLGNNAISGTLGLTQFADYALTADLLESELLDALAWDCLADLPLRDVYLPDLASVLDLPGRLCVGGVVALCAIARPASRLRGPADYVLLVQERSGSVLNAARRLSVIPNGFHQPMTDVRADAQLGGTLRREMEEELFGRADIDNTMSGDRWADPMHPSRLSEPMRWLDEHPDRCRMECTGFGINLVSGNFEFAGLVVIDDEEFWHQYGSMIEGNWESAGLRQFSSLDRDPAVAAGPKLGARRPGRRAGPRRRHPDVRAAGRSGRADGRAAEPGGVTGSDSDAVSRHAGRRPSEAGAPGAAGFRSVLRRPPPGTTAWFS